ncbi:hypothetical protein [Pedobacter heparinus]|uniref:hypothetical protein n=1 Tax=Pedobacter heparinus TaxID=984 RepID=UPI00292DDB5A|nr:hypothetical protein [Pedobacter heparinus]
MKAEQFFAGAARIDITPPLGTRINGDFITHFAHTIHDRLYAKALALKSGTETIVMVVVDICYMQDDFLRPIRKELAKKTGIPHKNFLFCCTHSHSAGAVTDLLLGAADLPYTRKLPGLIKRSVFAAIEALVPAKIAFGKVEVPEHILCRRYFMKEGYQAHNPVTGNVDQVKTNPFGVEEQILAPVAKMDTELCYLAVKDVDDQWISLLANYSLHYVGDFGSGIISADYFGEFSEQVKNALGAGDEFVGMMSNGTSGEANIWDFLDQNRYPKEDFGKTRLIAKDLANKVAESLGDLKWDRRPMLLTAYAELFLPVNKPSIQELDAAKKILSAYDFENIKVVDPDTMKKIYAREQVLLNDGPDEEILPIQAIRIGEGVIGALAGEFFAETGLWLKENSPVEHYFSIGLANGAVGYVPPAHEIERGGYETWRCRSSKLKKGSEAIVKERLLQLINEVSNQRLNIEK